MTSKRTPEQVDADLVQELKHKKELLRTAFIERVNAGLFVSLEEWNTFGAEAKEVWEEIYTENLLKRVALEAHFIADSMRGGTLAIEAVWDVLPEDVQNKYLTAWSSQNAAQNKKSD